MSRSSSHNASVSVPIGWPDPVAARVFSELYPMGPRDGRVWQRAGGDLSTLELSGTGYSMWHGAIEKVQQGARPALAKLLEVALEDFPANPTLLALVEEVAASGSSQAPSVGQGGTRGTRSFLLVAVLLTVGILALGTTAFMLAFPSERGAAVEPHRDPPVSIGGQGILPAGLPTTRRTDSVESVRPPSSAAAPAPGPAAKPSRPSPARNGMSEDDAPPPAPLPSVREPEPAAYAFAPQALAEAEAEFRRGEYLLSLRRITTTSERLGVLEQRFPDAHALRSIRKDLSALTTRVRSACEEDAAVRRVAAQCT